MQMSRYQGTDKPFKCALTLICKGRMVIFNLVFFTEATINNRKQIDKKTINCTDYQSGYEMKIMRLVCRQKLAPRCSTSSGDICLLSGKINFYVEDNRSKSTNATRFVLGNMCYPAISLKLLLVHFQICRWRFLPKYLIPTLDSIYVMIFCAIFRHDFGFCNRI